MKDDLIFDVGMNNGDDTAYYLHKGYRVIAVEANPQLVEQTSKRFQREIETGRLVTLNVGIAATEGSMPFWVCESQSEWSSFDRHIASRDNSPHHEINVPCVRFRSLVEQFGVPYYLKVDIEGNDHLCLADLQPETRARYVSVEAADLQLLDQLVDRGYSRFKCISQFHYLPLESRPTMPERRLVTARRLLSSRNCLVRVFRRLGGRKWLEHLENQARRLGGWVFPHGSSGPFGGDLLGRWLEYDEMRETYESHCRRMHQRRPS
ncbi:MAG: FkbM family methyltransferase, partial [Bryobacteraceae bacterium]|nr:FkbM family methyltransferase [Bryobacteraceae bacterium]